MDQVFNLIRTGFFSSGWKGENGVEDKEAIEWMAELEEKGLVEKQARGSGMSSMIYLKNFAAA